MFNPPKFQVTDRDEMRAFLDAYDFGELVSLLDGEITASHIPFLPNADATQLRCHLARANPQWTQLEGQRVLVTLQGPHDYISPSWYEEPGVPTWNYQVLHIYGTCRVFDDPAEVAPLVNALTARHEARFEQPWQPDYAESMLRAIVGVDIDIESMACKYKLSQNRPAADHAPVVAALEERGAAPLAAAMRRTLDLDQD